MSAHPLKAKADAAVAEIGRAWAHGQSQIGRRWTDTQKSIGRAFDGLSPQIDEWKTKLRRWAEAGRRDDGTAYDFDRWFEHGRTFAASIKAIAGYAYDASVFKLLRDTATATADDLTNPLKWPGWLKWTAAAGVAVLALYVGVPIVLRRFP